MDPTSTPAARSDAVEVDQLWYEPEKDRWLRVISLESISSRDFATCRVVAKRVARRITVPSNSVQVSQQWLLTTCERADSTPEPSPADFAEIGIDRHEKQVHLDGLVLPWYVGANPPRVREHPDGTSTVVVTFHTEQVNNLDMDRALRDLSH